MNSNSNITPLPGPGATLAIQQSNLHKAIRDLDESALRSRWNEAQIVLGDLRTDAAQGLSVRPDQLNKARGDVDRLSQELADLGRRRTSLQSRYDALTSQIDTEHRHAASRTRERILRDLGPDGFANLQRAAVASVAKLAAIIAIRDGLPPGRIDAQAVLRAACASLPGGFVGVVVAEVMRLSSTMEAK